ncbi:MAG: relaxase/mobilization nuclease domain-containing protein, partial [Sideroxyarcus sp.]|nr:relaxase/mobilization nuclease domain-containing protein [Sideroxyarcus sp.]
MKRGKNSDVRNKLRKSSGSAQGRGRGIAIKGFKNGKTFGKRVSYAKDARKGGELIFTNCPPNEIAHTMKVATRTRPDIQHPAAHLSLSLPPSVIPKSREEWQQIVQVLLDEIGLDDAFPYVCARHSNTSHDHVHLVFSRVSVDGRVHDQANLGLRLQAAEAVIEDRFGLQLFDRGAMSLNVTKNEIEMGIRTGKLPPRVEIRKALEEALTDKPTVEQLVERLALAGVNSRINQSATTGKISGFSFEYEGIPFAASKIGKEYGWQHLQERITYEQQDGTTEQDTQQSKPESTAGNDIAAAGPKPAQDDARGHDRLAQATASSDEQDAPERAIRSGGSAELRVGVVDSRVWHRGDNRHLHCGIRNLTAPVKVHQADFKTPAWFLLGEKQPVAVELIDGGIMFPDHHRLSDEQLAALIKAVGNPVE